MNKKIIPFLLVALIATGCSSDKSDTSIINGSGENVVVRTDNNADDTTSSKESEQIKTFLSKDPTYVDIINYLKNNTTKYNESNALLFERYILSAESKNYELSRDVFDQVFLDELNNTLGGSFDISKIPSIKNDKLRNVLQDAADGMLTIVRYEEVPVFEIDYSRLADFSDLFDVYTQEFIKLKAKLQDYDYYTTEYALDHEQLAKDIIAVENLISKDPPLFIKSRLQQLMENQISRLLVGPEGSYLSELMDSKDMSATYVGDIAMKYEKTFLGQICRDMINNPKEDFMTYIDIINSYNHFPGDTEKKLINKEKEFNGYKYYGFDLTGFDDHIILSVNNIIDHQFDEYTTSVDTLDDLKIHQYTYFVNENYLSIGLSRTYSNSESAYNEDQVYLNIDLKTGEVITLDELFGKDFNDYKEQLSKLISEEVDLSQSPDFYLTDDGVVVLPKVVGRSYPNFTIIGLDNLRMFMDQSLLY